MKRRISAAMMVSGTILLLISMVFSTVSFAAPDRGRQESMAGSRFLAPPQSCDPRPCDDGNACTENDTEEGVLDSWCDDPRCTNKGQCEESENPDGCNSEWHKDQCKYSGCEGTSITCVDGDVCTDDSCDPATGCVYTNNTSDCDDGDPCTENDVCSGGDCAGTDKDCSALDDQCVVGVCNPASGNCEADNLPAGTSCSDDDECTDPDVCDGAGACDPGPDICGEPPECTVDADCTALNDECNVGVCNQTTGTCEAQPANEGGSCNDGNACTQDEVCSAGECTGGTAVVCDDDNECTDDSCNTETGCVYTNNTAACDDLNACTTNDTCSEGQCVGGDPPDCADQLECSVDACDPAKGCTHDLSGCECETAADCDDSNVCTEDACVDLMCENTQIAECCNVDAECTDDNLCTDDTCVDNECVFTPAGPRACYDGPAGTVGVGVCQAGTQTCSDNSWGACVGQVLPGTEICDDKDNDCDGKIDEGGVCGAPPPEGPPEAAPTPTPTPVVEVLGVEELPTAGVMPVGPALPILPMIFSSLALIGGGLLLWGDEDE